MGTINDKLEYMNGTKLDIRDALIEQKQEVPPSTPFRAYGDIIRGLDTTDTSDATATSNDILDGKTAYVNKEKLTGTMVDNGELTYTPSTSSQSIPAGYTSGGTIAGVDSSIDNNIQSYNIKAGVNILGVEGNVEPDKPDQEKTVNPSTSIQEVTADTGYELAKVTVNAIETETKNVKSTTTSQTVTPTAGKFINEITVEPIELESKVVTPTTSQQVITPSQDKDGIGQVTVSGVDASIDNNIVSGNIKANTTILGVQGKSTVVDTEDANAVANKMISGYSAYVNGEKINGSIVPVTTTYAPSVSNISLATDSQHPNQIRIGSATWQNVYLQGGAIALWFNQYNLASRLGIQANELKKGSTVLGITGNYTSDANATANDILENKTAYVNGNKVTGSMTNLGQLDITPTTTAQTIPAGYTSGGIVNAVPDETSVLNAQDTALATQGIKISDLATALNNKIALDLTNATADANATASDIKQGKSAYVNGQKINGTIPHFANRDMTSLNSMLEYEIRSFVNYLDEQYEQQTPYLNEPITIYAPDENMKYFVISKTTDNQFRILWSATKFGNLQHKTTTENKVNFYKKMASKATYNSFLINSIVWEYSNYGNGTFNNFIELNRTYHSSKYSTLEDLISAISNPNSSITYSHPNNEPSYSCTPNFNNITNMFFWENEEIGDGKSMNTFVNHRKLSNNITILPLQ